MIITISRISIVLLLLSISYLAFSPGGDAQTIKHLDKLNHILAFSTLSLVACFAFPTRRVAITAGLLIFGITIELIQSQIPGRTGSIYDIAADAMGIMVGLIAYPFIGRSFSNNKRPDQQTSEAD